MTDLFKYLTIKDLGTEDLINQFDKFKNENYRDIELLKYQKNFIKDRSKFLLVKKSRQIGMSFAVALKALIYAYSVGFDVLLLSPTRQQSQRLTRYVRLFNNILVNKFGDIYKFRKDNEQELVTNRIMNGEITGEGSHISILAANEGNVRGSNGMVIIDESVWVNNLELIYSALLPSISTSPDCCIILISSVGTKEGLFYEVDEGRPERYPDFKRLAITVDEAKEQGHPIDNDTIKRNMDDDDYEREFNCIYSDDKLVYIGYDLINSCEITNDDKYIISEEIYAGVDFARHTNLTVVFIASEVNGVLIQSEELIELHNKSFEDQEAELIKLMEQRDSKGAWRIKKLAFDGTGIGANTGEKLKTRFGNRIECLTLNNEFNENAVTNLKRDMEARKILFYRDENLRKDIHGIKKSWTKAGNVRFISDLNIEGEGDGKKKTSHCDRFWAMAYCNYARYTKTPAPIDYKPSKRTFGSTKRRFKGI